MNLSKTRIENLLLIASIPFFVVAVEMIDPKNYLPTLEEIPTLEERECEVVHETARKCTPFVQPSPYFHGV
jgi:hypothetical protein